MNEYEYINDTIAREVAYADGFDAGKQAAEQIFEEFEEILTEKLEAFNKAHKESESEYWQGRAVTCGETLHLISELKKKYEVK
jgi:fructoselysine-6-P-deglycase FrlB-like protein